MLTGRILGATTALMIVSAHVSVSQTSNAPPPPPQPQIQAVDRDTLSPLDRIVSVDLQGVALKTALHEIAAQANVRLEYSSRFVPIDKLVSVRVTNVTVRAALSEALQGTDVEIVLTPARSILLVKRQARGRISGEVKDSATGRPIDQAAVTIIGADTTATDTARVSGWYSFDLHPGRYVLRARSPGYVPFERPVVLADSEQLRVDIALSMGKTSLPAVIVTASGPRRRLDVGNDVTIVNADSLVKNEPISTVTQMLEGRVPGLEVQHTSGTPGDPSRLRLRGASSALSTNDPIVIIDGVRVYSAQSDSLSGNLAAAGVMAMSGGLASDNPVFGAPSPLDQIDPNNIESIEVFKGPSAATLYGPDAANGVIVVTTKRGQPGPARWTGGASHGTTFVPGTYPDGVYRWGHNAYGGTVPCLITDFTCRADSVVRFQALNNPAYTILGHGNTTQLALGVSGGTGSLTYALDGSSDRETGLVTLPSVEAQQYETQHAAPPPDWMQRPDQLSRWSGSSRLIARLNDRTEVSIITTLTRERQQRSDLNSQLAALMATYVDAKSNTYWTGAGRNFTTTNVLLPSFYTRATDAATNLTTGVGINWQPHTWLTVSADAGLNVINRNDEVFLPHGALVTDSGGTLTEAHGSTVLSTVNLRASGTAPLPLGFRFVVAGGVNYTQSSLADLASTARDLVPGTTSLNGAGRVFGAWEAGSEVKSFGWYLEPSFIHQLFTLTTGLRIDGSSGFGTHVNLPAPKFGVSWLVSDEPYFPFKTIFDVLRLRAAYGRAGVWPAATQQLRLYQSSEPWLDGGFVNVTTVSTLGNTQVRPERSTEWEGGFDTDLLANHLSLGLTVYKKDRQDALMNVPVAPSVYGSGVSVTKNIGEIRNSGLELTMTSELVRSREVTWSETLNFTHNHNMVVLLGRGVDPFYIGQLRVAPGYPLFGFWANPILGYYDANHDGIIEASEVRVGDSAVFIGSSEPKYQANLFTNVSLFGGALTATAGLAYQHALTQINYGIGGMMLPAYSDPSVPLSAQAAVVARTGYGLFETVSVLRLNSCSMAYHVPQRLARGLGTQAIAVQLQGTNLALWTRYRGKDPNVNAFATGNSVADTGVLPVPRTWLVSVHVAY